jgi:hypothetical protein
MKSRIVVMSHRFIRGNRTQPPPAAPLAFFIGRLLEDDLATIFGSWNIFVTLSCVCSVWRLLFAIPPGRLQLMFQMFQLNDIQVSAW